MKKWIPAALRAISDPYFRAYRSSLCWYRAMSYASVEAWSYPSVSNLSQCWRPKWTPNLTRTKSMLSEPAVRNASDRYNTHAYCFMSPPFLCMVSICSARGFGTCDMGSARNDRFHTPIDSCPRNASTYGHTAGFRDSHEVVVVVDRQYSWIT